MQVCPLSFEISTPILQSFVTALSTRTECNFYFFPSNKDQVLRISTLDETHTLLFYPVLFKKAFETYKCTQNLTIGIHISSLQKILHCASANHEFIGMIYYMTSREFGEF